MIISMSSGCTSCHVARLSVDLRQGCHKGWKGWKGWNLISFFRDFRHEAGITYLYSFSVIMSKGSKAKRIKKFNNWKGCNQ